MDKAIHLDIPFYGNTDDDTHCFQAMLRAVLKKFWPTKEYSWEELETLTAKPAGKATWPMGAAISLTKMGVEVRMIEIFDYDQFAKEGVPYLQRMYGDELAKWQKRMSDIPQERRLAAELKQHVTVEKRIPTIQDIKKLTEEGYLVAANVNSYLLNERKGYAGHSVLVIRFDNNNVWIHDPGLPPLKDRKVPWKTFEKAWYYPDKKSSNVLAFKKK